MTSACALPVPNESRQVSDRIVSAALEWARIGFRVLPLFGMIPDDVGHLRCSCGEPCASPGRHSWIGSADEASTDAATIRGWWSWMPESNLAVLINGSLRYVSGLHASSPSKVKKLTVPPTREGNAIYAAALDLAERGFRVVPVCGLVLGMGGRLTPECRRSSCDRPGKHPLHKDWQLSASTDPHRITKWWTEWPNANVGIFTGNGIVAIDLDLPKESNGHQDGHVVWETLQQIHGLVPPTRTATTGSGGSHLLFRTEHDNENSLPVLATFDTDMGGVIDVRGKDSGLIVAPPSRHISGEQYRWVDIDAPIAVAPEWFYESPEVTVPQDPKQLEGATISMPTSKRRIAKKPPKELDALDQEAGELVAFIDSEAMLAKNTAERIRFGNPIGDQSAVVSSITMGAVSVNFDPETLYDILKDPANLGGIGLRRRIEDDGEASARGWFYTTITKSRRYRAEALASIRLLRAEAKKYEWDATTHFIGRNRRDQAVLGKNLKGVLNAAFDIAKRTTTTAPMIGMDQLHELTGKGTNTCRRAVQALEHLGWWVPVDVSTGKQDAYTYRFILDPASRLDPPKTVSVIVKTSRFPMPTLSDMYSFKVRLCQLPLSKSEFRAVMMNQATPVTLARAS